MTTTTEKRDVYNHERRYASWKEHVLKNGEEGLTPKNNKQFLSFVFDLQDGNNISIKSKKGARSYHRLNAVRQKVSKVIRLLQERGLTDIAKVKDSDLSGLFEDMRKGKVKSGRGTDYTSTADYVQAIKTFWHWHQRVQLKKGNVVKDVTELLDARQETKPVWVYLDEKNAQKLLKQVSPKYLTFLEFLYDSGARVTEALSLRVSDISEDKGFVTCNIRPEIAKSSGRKIRLLMCGKRLLKYIKESELSSDEFLFPYSAPYLNRYLQNISKGIFGETRSQGGELFRNLTLYDWRHCSACYWIQRYKRSIEIMYRFGWKSEKYLHYYTEFLGLRDTISHDDLYVDITKTELEKQLATLQKERVEDKKILTRADMMIRYIVKSLQDGKTPNTPLTRNKSAETPAELKEKMRRLATTLSGDSGLIELETQKYLKAK